MMRRFHDFIMRSAGPAAAKVPDPFIFALLLTAAAALAAWARLEFNAPKVLDIWYSGFWKLLAFSMQMCLILVTGHVLAAAPQMQMVLRRLCALPRSAPQAAALVAAITVLLALFNWGLALVSGALLAREMNRACLNRGLRVPYALLAACGYSGLMVWHGGLSGSAPLKVTSIKDLAELVGPAVAQQIGAIPITETLGSPLNIAVTLGACLITTGLAWLFALAPSVEAAPPESDYPPAAATSANLPPAPPAGARNSRWPGVVFGTLFLLQSARMLSSGGWLSLDPDKINLIFLGLGLIAHGSPTRYAAAAAEAVQGCSGIVIQFPFYAGIMALVAGSGLAASLVSPALAMAGPIAAPIYTYFSAAILNIAIPSGGGQWAVQGPIALQTALELGIPPAKFVMAVAYGDQLTNMIQPFWALPLLGITGLRAGSLLTYTSVFMIAACIWTVICFAIF